MMFSLRKLLSPFVEPPKSKTKEVTIPVKAHKRAGYKVKPHRRTIQANVVAPTKRKLPVAKPAPQKRKAKPAELHIDWSKAEPWVKCHIINPMGWGMWLARMPEQESDGTWVNLGYWESSYIQGPVRKDWWNTIVARPRDNL